MLVDQLLHGYNNGHHLIAGSVSLPLADADRMSYLSDWSGYENPFDNDTSYITLYPLKESQCFVIAKSWYADEMQRPGCVWTHSLVVKLKALRSDFIFGDLLKLFRRPDKKDEDFMSYTKPIDVSFVNSNEGNAPLTSINPTRFMYLAATLLDRKKPAVYMIEKGTTEYINLCLRLVQYVPFGFLKDLAICSGSASVRKFEGGFYNLQFVTGKGELLMEPFPNSVSKPNANKGFEFWVDSVLNGRDDVAHAIHVFSYDIGSDSTKFLAVMNLLKILDDRIAGNDGAEPIVSVIEYLGSAFSDKSSGLTLKKSFLGQSISRLFCNEKDFIFEMATTNYSSSFDYNEIGFKRRVLSFRMNSGLDNYIALLSMLLESDGLNLEGQQILVDAFDGLSTNELIEIATKNWQLFKSIVALNAEALANDFWLDFPSIQFISLFQLFQKSIPSGFHAWERLYDKLLTINTFTSDSVCQRIQDEVADFVFKALDKWNSGHESSINMRFLSFCMRKIHDVLVWIGHQEMINGTLRVAIKDYIRPDDEQVIVMGSWVWRSFVKNEVDSNTDANELIYSYSLAFNWHDDFSLSYIKIVLPIIYDALSHDRIDYSSWMKLEKFTGQVPFWRSWDNCMKVLVGVKDYCKVMRVDSDVIKNFTTNSKLNKELFELWQNS